jgi:hypothetical protein
MMLTGIIYVKKLSGATTTYWITVNKKICTRKLNLRYYHGISLEGLRKPRKPSVNIVRVPAESEIGLIPYIGAELPQSTTTFDMKYSKTYLKRNLKGPEQFPLKPVSV